MANITLTGNLFKDPELKQSQNGTQYALAQMGWSESEKDKQGNWQNSPTIPVMLTVFGRDAQNFVQSAHKGDRVTVIGRAIPAEWQSENGPVTQIKMTVQQISIDLKFASAQVNKNQSGGQQGGWNNTQQQPQQQNPWNSQPQQGSFPTGDDEPPF